MTNPADVTSDLRAKLVALEGQQLGLTAERDQIAYPACTGDKKGRSTTEAVHAEMFRLDQQHATLSAALKEAVRRENEAERAAHAERRRGDAETAQAMLADVEKLGRDFDSSLASDVQIAVEIRSRTVELRRLTGAGPTPDPVSSNIKRAMISATMGGPLHSVHLAPADRTTATELAQSWTRSVQRWIDSILQQKAA
jgi:hypothetical protein